jgi:hypothetical protein
MTALCVAAEGPAPVELALVPDRLVRQDKVMT